MDLRWFQASLLSNNPSHTALYSLKVEPVSSKLFFYDWLVIWGINKINFGSLRVCSRFKPQGHLLCNCSINHLIPRHIRASNLSFFCFPWQLAQTLLPSPTQCTQQVNSQVPKCYKATHNNFRENCCIV